MTNEQTKDQIVLDGLLTEMAKRLDGAVDFWTIICLSPTMQNRHEWLQEQLDRFRSLVVVIKSIWPRQTPTPEAWALLKNLDEAYHKLDHSFLILERFQKEDLESIRAATEDLAEIHKSLPDTISKLGQTIGLEIGYLREKNLEREKYFQNILTTLFQRFCQERDQTKPEAVPAGIP